MPEGEKIEKREFTVGKDKITNAKKLTTIYLKNVVKLLTVIYQSFLDTWKSAYGKNPLFLQYT